MRNEDRLLAGIDRRRQNREELSPTIKIAHERAQKLLADPSYTLQETDFINVYGADAVAADIAETNRLSAKFQQGQTQQLQNAKIIAEVLEAIILEHSELSEWLGNAQTLKTTRYDDFKNKTDMVVEWYSPEDGSRILALAVDVTFGATTVAKKMEAIKAEIDSGILGSLRYFKDQRGDFVGTRNNVPRVVIGIGQSAVENLAAIWNRNDKKALANHPIQRVIVEEITEQLELMAAYAAKTGKMRVAEAFAPSLTIMRSLRAQKRNILLADLSSDRIAEAIHWDAKRFFS